MDISSLCKQRRSRSVGFFRSTRDKSNINVIEKFKESSQMFQTTIIILVRDNIYIFSILLIAKHNVDQILTRSV